VTEYESRSARVAVYVRCVEKDALSDRTGQRHKTVIDRLDKIERAMSRARLPQ
jgi:hypothetical protein